MFRSPDRIGSTWGFVFHLKLHYEYKATPVAVFIIIFFQLVFNYVITWLYYYYHWVLQCFTVKINISSDLQLFYDVQQFCKLDQKHFHSLQCHKLSNDQEFLTSKQLCNQGRLRLRIIRAHL